jgi:hypothetical protein
VGEIKIMFRYADGIDKPIVKPQWPLAFDLSSDPGEKHNLMREKLDMMWKFAPALNALGTYKPSMAKYPNIKPGEECTEYGGAEPPTTARRRPWETTCSTTPAEPKSRRCRAVPLPRARPLLRSRSGSGRAAAWDVRRSSRPA